MNAINKGIVSNKISGLSEEWIKTRLGDSSNFEIIMGQSPPSSLYNTKREGLPFLQGKMEFGGVFPSPSVYCSKPVKIADKNDILISVRAPVGDVNISRSRLCIGRGLASIRCDPQKISYVFLFYFLKHKKTVFENISSGSTFKAIRRNELDNFEILLPSPNEQKKIAEVLSTVDQAIEKVGEAIEKTQRLKKGLMAELLTKGLCHCQAKSTEIGLMPANWKILRLSDILCNPPQNGLYKSKEYFNGGYKLVRMTELFKKDILDVKEMLLVNVNTSELKKFSLKSGDLLFARRSLKIEGAGKCVLVPAVKENILFESSIIRVTLNQSLAYPLFFLYYFISLGRKQISGMTRTVSVSGITGKDLQNIKIPVPPLLEQKKIAEIFSSLDERLESLSTRKKRLEKTKKGLMEDLLTGRKRINLEA
jgi:type I restriction enzyme S subunit